jgi:hypothetical protein
MRYSIRSLLAADLPSLCKTLHFRCKLQLSDIEKLSVPAAAKQNQDILRRMYNDSVRKYESVIDQDKSRTLEAQLWLKPTADELNATHKYEQHDQGHAALMQRKRSKFLNNSAIAYELEARHASVIGTLSEIVAKMSAEERSERIFKVSELLRRHVGISLLLSHW